MKKPCFYHIAHFLVFFVLLISCSPKEKIRESKHRPDTVFINGKFITVDKGDTIAEALAVKDGKITAIGSNKEIEILIDQGTCMIDLQGLTATPGLIDSHCHFAKGGIGMLYTLNLNYPEVNSIRDIIDKVKAKVKTVKPYEWIYGRGWDEGKLSELRYVYASDLAPVSPDNPVWLHHTMGHYGTANSYALKLANITQYTPDPPGGSIDRYKDGTPTGVLKEKAMDLVLQLLPEISPEQRQNAIFSISKEFNKEGMTAIKDPGIGFDIWDGYQKVLQQDKLTVRTFVLWIAGGTVQASRELIKQVGPFTKPYISTGDDMLISGGIKIYLDGSGGARTAWLYDEWNKDFNEVDNGNYGYPVIDPVVFRKQVIMFHNAGLHMSAHSIGDRAIDLILDCYSLALNKNPIRGLRHGIIHCCIPSEKAIELMTMMQKNYDAAYPESQSTFMWWIGDTYAANWGPKRCPRLNPFKTYVNKGIKWGGGSDFSVTPFPAKYGIWASIARKTLLGVYGENPWGKKESVDVKNALRSYTIWNAHQLFMEDKIGSLEVGKYADIAVWDRDLYSIPTEEIANMRCLMTMVGGKIAYKTDDRIIKIYENR